MSLRARLMLGALAAALLVCGVGGITLDALLRAAIEDAFDQSLVSQARAMQVLIDYDEDGYQFDWESDSAQLGGLPRMFQVRIAGGKLLRQSEAAERISVPWPELAANDEGFESLDLPASGRARAYVVRFLPRVDKAARDKPRPLELLVAQSTEALDAELQRVRVIVALCALGAVILSAATVVLVVPRALAPLKRVSGEIATMNPESLAPISESGVPRELKPVVTQLNALLARTNAVLDRERQFSAGAAHELRTPLAGLRAKLELALSRERSAAEHAKLATDCLGLATSMQVLLQNLLLFARGGGDLPPPQSIDVAALVKQISALHSEKVTAKRVRLTINETGGGVIQSQRELLAVILQNLMGNAVEYVNVNGEISVSIGQSSDGLELIVSNSGCELKPEDVSHVFEPFWRGDGARTGDGAHAGLGLAICRRLADAISASLGVSVRDGRFEARLGLHPGGTVPKHGDRAGFRP
jgi:two-component system, OmpR family, heavy metal sensor histidine kinase CusS